VKKGLGTRIVYRVVLPSITAGILAPTFGVGPGQQGATIALIAVSFVGWIVIEKLIDIYGPKAPGTARKA